MHRHEADAKRFIWIITWEMIYMAKVKIDRSNSKNDVDCLPNDRNISKFIPGRIYEKYNFHYE